jgi:hypothetical protein
MENKSINNNQVNVQPQGAPTPPPPMPAYYQPRPFVKKVYEPMSKRDGLFALIFLAGAFILMDLAIFKGFYAGFSAAYFIIFVITSVYLKNNTEKVPVFPYICGFLSLAGSVTLALYDNPLIKTIMVVLICGLYTIYCIGISGTFNRKTGSYKMLFDMGMAVLPEPIENLSEVIGSAKAGSKGNKKLINAILGIVVALPVLLIIIPLLVKSDAAFEALIKAIAKNIGIYLAELLAACIVTPYIFSFMYGKKHRLNKKKIAPSSGNLAKVPVPACVSFLCMISLTYIVYIVSQLAYFLSAFSGLLPKGYSRTASAFARRGFFEMFAVCAINILIITVVTAISKRGKDGKPSMSVKVLSCFISLFSIFMIVTAMQKMKLNISIYGLTTNRIMVGVFFIMMLVVIAFFILHIFAPKVSYMQPIIVICSLMFIVMAFADVDGYAFRYNINAFESGKLEMLDIPDQWDITDSQMKYLPLAAKVSNKKTAHRAETEIFELIRSDYPLDDIKYKSDKVVLDNGSDIRKYCKTRADSRKALIDYYEALDKENRGEWNRMFKEFKNYEYIAEDDYYTDYTRADKTVTYRYNEKTGRYDIIEEEKW